SLPLQIPAFKAPLADRDALNDLQGRPAPEAVTRGSEIAQQEILAPQSVPAMRLARRKLGPVLTVMEPVFALAPGTGKLAQTETRLDVIAVERQLLIVSLCCHVGIAELKGKQRLLEIERQQARVKLDGPVNGVDGRLIIGNIAVTE